jgi:hypothetical protein
MRSVLLACAVLVLPACASDPEYVVDVGEIRVWPDQGPDIDVPMTASVGTTFGVKVTTHGDGCTSDDHTDVTATPDGALVVPYDRHRTGVACTAIDQDVLHTAPVVFDAAGTYTVLVRGRGKTRGDGVTVLYDHAFTVVVQ